MTYLLICGCLTLMFAAIWLCRSDDRPVAAVMTASAAYYGLGGQIYWAEYQRGVFAGLQWDPAKLSEASVVVAATALATVLCIVSVGALGRWSKRERVRDAYHVRKLLPPPVNEARGIFEIAFLLIGISCALYVLAKSSFAANFNFDTRGQLFLIAYQLSDILVAWICFDVARRGIKTTNLAVIGFFILYAVLVGFRYKIAIVALPLIIYGLTSPMSRPRKWAVISSSTLGVLVLFSVMTLFRVKFAAPDFTRGVQNLGTNLTYGAFAEANVLFGMASIMRVHIEGQVTAGLQPIVDAVLELVPRLILPFRTTGEYLRPMVQGFLTDQGMKSGTAYPWIGEFVIMFGRWGLLVGPPAFAGLYFLMKRFIRAAAGDLRQYYMGLYLLAGIVGYYHFGRGYTPQLLKCYLFVCLPFILMCLERLLPARTFRISLLVPVRTRAAR
ncbi:hypothetical protein [Brevundimonas sp.]|uniref:hypothetical protein n=1 Tax=Brevundimonas sp. TaxID=1871086 RepID=UPI00260B3E5C|nr:hypothetical protein [Brevundimonas sp.]